MKCATPVTAVALIVCFMSPAYGQQTAAPSVPPQQATPSQNEQDKQFARMQEQMAKMNEQMTKIQQTQDPQERQRLLNEHWSTMQTAMGTMQGMTGCCGTGQGSHMMGGPMMGGHMMMWNDYRNLTPEQLKQRQFTIDRWMPMQQMMMNQMMQHQHWMMQQPAPPTPVK
jgi:hypothetical protein